MTLQTFALLAITFWLILGAILSLAGTIGLLKFNDSMTRLHAPTKVGTVGVGALLLASMIHAYLNGDGSMHELLIMSFLFVTAPISANFIAKVNMHRGSCETPPPPRKDNSWATLDTPAEDGAETGPQEDINTKIMPN